MMSSNPRVVDGVERSPDVPVDLERAFSVADGHLDEAERLVER